MKILSEAEKYIMSILWEAGRPLALFEIDEVATKKYWKNGNHKQLQHL